MVYILSCTNSEVTEFYLDIVKKMFLEHGYEVCNVDKIKKADKKDDIIVASTLIDVLKKHIEGYRNIIYWMQGIDAEESYLKHHSYIRKLILSSITYIALKKSKGIIFVSNEMRKFIEKKYNIEIKNKSFIMPCFNSEIKIKNFYETDKYKNNIFSYIGSLSEWQCFNETIEFYKEIEEIVPNSELRVYTFSVEEAKEILEEKKVKNYVVDKVKKEDIVNVLKDVKFGFTLREDIDVNNVATPTKLSSYLSAGVIPIFSKSIKDFYEVTKDMKYVIPIQDYNVIPNKIFEFCENEINPDDVYSEYKQLFLKYYNMEVYIEKSKHWLGGIFYDYKKCTKE